MTKGDKMKITDAHAHIFPEKIAEKATHSISEFYSDEPMEHMGNTEELLKSGRAAGVSRYVVFSTATTAKQVPKINEFIIGEAEKHSEFVPVGTMHADYEQYEEEIERIYAAGVRGIKLHPDFQKFNIDDERMFPIYRLLEEKGMFVITHSGDYRYGFSHPQRVANVAGRFKKLKISAAHCGGWSQWDIAPKYLVLPNVYVDTSSTFGFSGKETVENAIRCFGEDKVFFGTDFPMWDHKSELENMYSLNLKSSVLEKILSRNFDEFYEA